MKRNLTEKPKPRKKLIQRRKEMGMSLADVAEYLKTNFPELNEYSRSRKGYSRSHIGAVERGENNPSIPLAKALSKVYNLTLEDIL